MFLHGGFIHEKTCAHLHGMRGTGGAVSCHAGVSEYLEVVASLEGFVPKEVDRFVLSFRDEVETEGFVPSCGKNVEGYLTTDRIG